MKTHTLAAAGAVFGGVFMLTFAVCSCSHQSPPVKPPDISASRAGEGAMQKYDANGDGVVSDEELDKAPSLKAALKSLDANGDGGVSSSEVNERVRAWQKTPVGVMQLSCTVRIGGRPLEGATVKFVPEGFLGSEIQAAEGTTNQSGEAAISIPDHDPPGVACGLYRVEISKPDGSIPPKYNTDTTLGLEVALDAPAARRGITFELEP
ncbi:MAG: hypothetical protein ABIK89_17340 [Planctomycetota bacterium]